MIWLPVGFILGWFIAAELLVHKASQFAAMSLHGQINEWRDVLSSCLESGEAPKAEKIKFVLESMKGMLGG